MVRAALVLAGLAASANALMCGYKYGNCTTAGYQCVPVLPWCRDLSRCIGSCVLPGSTGPAPDTYQNCGGMMPVNGGKPCPRNMQCVSDPRTPGCGMACDAAGICVPKKLTSCTTNANCASNMQCFDNPGDSCDPSTGANNCPGVCLFPLTLASSPATPAPTPAPAAPSSTPSSSPATTQSQGMVSVPTIANVPVRGGGKKGKGGNKHKSKKFKEGNKTTNNPAVHIA